jgi:DNA-binding CsgD family transcriptional regulator
VPDQTVNARADAAVRLSSILLSDSADTACARLLAALEDMGLDGFCLGASEPAPTTGARRFTPVVWRGSLPFQESAGGRFASFLDAARSTGWLLVPLGQSAARSWVLAVSRPVGRSADAGAISLLELYGHAVKAVLVPAAAIAAAAPELAHLPLSGTQLNFLRWAAEGKSSADIAAISGATRRAVDYHFAEILRKLGVASRVQAVAWLAQADTARWAAAPPETARHAR